MIIESIRYWIIPIICLVIVVGVIFPVALHYKITVIIPNAEDERQEMKKMSCSELMAKDSLNDYWTPGNGKIGRAMIAICKELIKKEDSGLSPYVEFCTPGGFSPDKLIDNSTHIFNHDTCLWVTKNSNGNK